MTTVRTFAQAVSPEMDARAQYRLAEDLLAKGAPPGDTFAAIKKALHSQVSRLADLLGYLKWQHPGLDDLVRREAFIEGCGILVPAILQKIATLHECGDRPDTYLAAVQCFVEATDQHTRWFPSYRHIEKTNGNTPWSYCICTRRMSGIIRVYECGEKEFAEKSGSSEREDIGGESLGSPIPIAILVDVAEDEAAYFAWMRILLGYSQRTG